MRNNSAISADLQEICTTMATLHEPGALVELCAIGNDGVISGYYDDHDALARQAKSLSDSGAFDGIYVTVNPIKPEVPKQRGLTKNGKCQRTKQRTKDEDIERRRWLVLDVDPVRAPRTSATSRQKAVASWCKTSAVDTLRSKSHMPEPVIADSGNGYYALYRTDAPNDPEMDRLFKGATQAIAAKFSMKGLAVIDPVTHNASRLIKLFGTVARKGVQTDDTPHRFSELGGVPANLQVVTCEKLRQLTKELGASLKIVGGNGNHSTTATKLEDFLKRAGIGHRPAAQEPDGSLKWIIDACPFNEQHTNSPALFIHPDGTIGFHCFHKSCEGKGWADFCAAIEDKTGETFSRPNGPAPYELTADGIMWHKVNRKGEYTAVLLTNFPSEIVSDILEDDGLQTHHLYEIDATVQGKKRRISLTASELVNSNWPMQYLGARAAILEPGNSARDRVRVALQLISSNVQEQTVFKHTGWRCIDGRHYYLHGDGAIGADGLDASVMVKLPPSLKAFRLPEPPSGEELKSAVQASLRLLSIAPLRLTAPVYAAIWRTPIATSDFSYHCVGPSGAYKSSVMALGMQHFGVGFGWHSDHWSFPARWADTENSISQMQFILRHAPCAVDDLSPKEGQAEVARMHSKADRVFRGQGNNAGRGRMQRDGMSLRDPAPPRGTTWSTGEDIPRGESVQARVLIIEYARGDVDFARLKACQRDANAGLYAQAMAAYLKWIAPQREAIREGLHERVDRYYAEATRNGEHARTPGIVANLMAGFFCFLRFAVAVGALGRAQAILLKDKMWKALVESAATQTRGLAAEDPSRRFVDLVAAAVRSGVATIGDAGVGCVDSEATRGRKIIGWLSAKENLLYLDPDSSFAVANQLANQQGEGLPFGKRTLWKRLRDRGLLAQYTKDHNTVKAKIASTWCRVLCMRKSDVFPSADPEEDE
jgi:hypothetical protein